MEWSGKTNFGAAGEVPFMVDGKEAGLLKTYEQLSFLKVGLSYIITTVFLGSAGFLIVSNNNKGSDDLNKNNTGARCRTHGSNGPAKSCIENAEAMDGELTYRRCYCGCSGRRGTGCSDVIPSSFALHENKKQQT